MSDSRSPSEPLDPAVAELFAKASCGEPSSEVRARVLRRTATTIAAMSAAAAVAPPVVKAFGARAITLSATMFVVGGALGATAAIVLRPLPAPHASHDERPIPAQVATSSATAGPAITAAPPEVPAPSRRPASPSGGTGSSEGLRIERAMIDDARALLASGDARAALARLAEHGKRFPKGRFEEEREALATQALVNVGRTEEARARASGFRERWPTSVYGPALDTTLHSIP